MRAKFVERLNMVADVIERHEVKGLGFNMGTWFMDKIDNFDFSFWGNKKKERRYPDKSFNNCGTVACIAGTAVIVRRQRLGHKNPMGILDEQCEDDTINEAATYLGLDYDTSQELFVGEGHGVDLHKITARQAVKCMRHLAETGEVDWHRAGARPE